MKRRRWLCRDGFDDAGGCGDGPLIWMFAVDRELGKTQREKSRGDLKAGGAVRLLR